MVGFFKTNKKLSSSSKFEPFADLSFALDIARALIIVQHKMVKGGGVEIFL